MNLRHNEMHKPTMSYDTALEQAGNTPWCYMDKAVEAIDAGATWVRLGSLIFGDRS